MPSFGPYELLRRLGSGGMGEAFLATLRRQDQFEKLLVIKRILPQLSCEEGFREMFRREARLAALLSHQNIVQIFDYGEADGQSFIAMEYVDGIDAATLHARAQRLEPAVVVQILEQAARGLDYAHRKLGTDGAPLGLVHRDPTPRNLLISCEGEVKWIDFGLAHALRQDGRENCIAGTVAYMAPEQALGRPLDARTDLFGLGVTAYQLFCGVLPFADVGDDLTERARVVTEGELVPASDHGLPPELDLFCVRALAADPRDRFQSAREMLAALDELGRRIGNATPHELAELVCAQRRGSESALPAIEPDRTLVGDEPVAPLARATPPEALPAVDTAAPADHDSTETVTGDSPESTTAARDEPPAAVSGLRGRHLAAAGALLVASLVVWAALATSARDDARRDAVESASAEPRGPRWEVTITSQPSGATVLFDGKVVGQTPHIARELEAREVPLRVRLEADGFRSVDLELPLGTGGGAMARDVVLSREPARLKVELVPAGATLSVNGVPVASDGEIELAPGPAVLLAHAPGYRTFTQTLEVEAGAVLSEQIVLEAEPAGLTIDVTPVDARVTVRRIAPEGSAVVATCAGPCKAPALAPGSYRVEAERVGHSPGAVEVELGPGEERSVSVTCTERPQPRAARLRAQGGAFIVKGTPRSNLAVDEGGFEFRGGGFTIKGRLERNAQGTMTLSLQPSPHTRFTIDGREHDKPNVAFLPLSRGRHSVRLAGDARVGFEVVVP